MSETIPGDTPDGTTEAQVETGNSAVDAVVASLEQLHDTVVADHVAIFEAAHEGLRAALSDAAATPPSPAAQAAARMSSGPSRQDR